MQLLRAQWKHLLGASETTCAHEVCLFIGGRLFRITIVSHKNDPIFIIISFGMVNEGISIYALFFIDFIFFVLDFLVIISMIFTRILY
jgi:hypothetical protein